MGSMAPGSWAKGTGIGVLLLFVLLAGCFKHTYTVGAGAPTGPVAYTEWRHHWIVGLISPGHELDVQDVCPSGDATIRQEQTFLNGLVAILTSGIYASMTVEVRCAGGMVHLDLNADEVRTIVSDAAFAERVGALLPGHVDDVQAAREMLLEE